MTKSIILASGSAFRKQLMHQAGLSFDVIPARIDERAIEEPLYNGGASVEQIADALAIAKASEVSHRSPGKYVVGSDQIMSMRGEIFHKSKTLEQARTQLLTMRGKTHRLSSAVSIVKNGETLWTHVATADMTFREYSEDFLDSYIERAGDAVLLSVGAYQFEGLGQQLFEKIEGDFFTILGLPMLPLLAALRNLEVIDA
jgi:septum formation protein